MAGLVEEIQRDALDPTTSLSSLLRKVRLAAAKLDLPSVEAWVDLELNGYPDEVPDYRKLHGRPRANNPMRGWIPIQGPAELMRSLSVAATGQSVGEIEHILARKGTIHVPMQPEMIDLINSQMRVPFAEMSIFIERADIAGILERVRTMILDWAIALEKSGITGMGMSFKREEQVAAQNSPAITIGSVGTLVGVVGSHNTVGNIGGGSVDTAQIRELTQQLQQYHASLVEAGANEALLSRSLDGLSTEMRKSEPNTGIIRALLSDARAALSGATGSLLATGALALIAGILGT
ncbi:hypothetical protein [Rhizobium sp. 2MFCol3.1]|uniref:AbiTii domain-containing protein n=1 Tax=Rhizobium sp. 2MFCol3.1 TaxID=1246459 RepID=UPI0003766344|nr:hypothetical protein [Rhizobium sp. 2MFCol3.1]